MQILGNAFYAVIFVSVIGSAFCVLSLLLNHILRCTLPLWFPICGMILFCFPLLSPDVLIFSPEKQEWLHGFYIACRIWIYGCGAFFICKVIRSALARKAIKAYSPCGDARLNNTCSRCASAIGLEKFPVLYWGALDTPICVTGAIRPIIIMDKAIIKQLTDKELSAVFYHELTHIKLKHLLLERFYDCVCILNWFNPFAWIAKGDFSLHCETDCDFNVLKSTQGKLTETEYASAIFRLLELSATQAAKSGNGVGALDFLMTKRRIRRITTKKSKVRDRLIAAVLVVFLAVTMIFSQQFSRQYFYPYPACNVGIEYSTGYNQ